MSDTLILILAIAAFIIVGIALGSAGELCEMCGKNNWSKWKPCRGVDGFGFIYAAKKKTCMNCGNEKVDYRS